MGKQEIEPVDSTIHFVVRTDEKGKKSKLAVVDAVSCVQTSAAANEILARHLMRGKPITTAYAEYRLAGPEEDLTKMPQHVYHEKSSVGAFVETIEAEVPEPKIRRREPAVEEAPKPTPELTAKEIAVKLFMAVQDEGHGASWLARSAGLEPSATTAAILDKLAAADKIKRTEIGEGKVRYSKI